MPLAAAAFDAGAPKAKRRVDSTAHHVFGKPGIAASPSESERHGVEPAEPIVGRGRRFGRCEGRSRSGLESTFGRHEHDRGRRPQHRGAREMRMEMQLSGQPFEGAATSGIVTEIAAWALTFEPPDNSAATSALLAALLNSVQRALSGKAEDARHFIAKAADLLNAEIARRRAGLYREPAAPANMHLAPWQRRRVIDFVEANLAETIRVVDLAEVTRLGVRQFSRAFRSDFGESPYAFVLRRRIEKAKEMLFTDQSLAHIAARCGFRSEERR